MRLIVGLTVLLALQLSCASVPLREPMPPESLLLTLEIDQVPVNGLSHPVARLRVKNSAPSPVAFSRTFGITNQPWLSFEIQTLGGRKIYYPADIDIFGETPSYICLQPEEVIEWEVDLLDWRPTFGGNSSNETYAFDLSPGRYEIRARYSDDPDRVKATCPGVEGTTTSAWVKFEVRDLRDQTSNLRA